MEILPSYGGERRALSVDAWKGNDHRLSPTAETFSHKNLGN